MVKLKVDIRNFSNARTTHPLSMKLLLWSKEIWNEIKCIGLVKLADWLSLKFAAENSLMQNCMCGETKENHEKPRPRLRVSWPRFQPGTPTNEVEVLYLLSRCSTSLQKGRLTLYGADRSTLLVTPNLIKWHELYTFPPKIVFISKLILAFLSI